MNKLRIFSWNANSEGAKALSEALNIKRIRHEGSKFKGGPNYTVINWGSTNPPESVLKSIVLNHPDSVKKCSDKKVFFNEVSEKVQTPEFTSDPVVAQKWLLEDKSFVMARTVLNGHGAQGLHVLDPEKGLEGFIKAPLYTKYIPKKDEYRVHVFRGKVIDVQRKALKEEFLEQNRGKINHKVRNLENGYIYARNELNVPEDVNIQSLKCIEVLELDFGAVDVIFNHKHQKAYVLEVNSAPGLMGTTLENYANAIKEIM